ncbi:MAG: LPS export ABC transporter periplasmic protein LptC [bacterium]
MVNIYRGNKRYLFLPVLYLLLLVVSGCQTIPSQEEIILRSDSLPVQEFTGRTVIFQFEEKKMVWTLKTDYILKLSGSEKTIIMPVDLIFFGETAGRNSTLMADTGYTNKDMSTMEAMGKVEARSYDGKVLETDYVKWVKETNRITSDRFVKLTTAEGDEMTGIGFESDAGLDHWKIFNGFKAVFKNVKERRKEK